MAARGADDVSAQATPDYSPPPPAGRKRRGAAGRGSPVPSAPPGAAHAHRLVGAMPDAAAPAASGLIRLQPGSVRAAAPTPLHLLPCEIRHNGPAAVERFFSPAIRPGPAGPVVSFRGRSLHGEEVPLPSGYAGLVLREEDKAQGSEDRTVMVVGTFDSFSLWGLETSPGPEARIRGALSWPSLAAAIHGPVAEDDD
ncbi:ribonuclease H2 subunit C [Macrotis lagotis]|uniref:ribonuclease H2 subunit C n=1 Tax=Macrotis lagotis TaxID=92651 RepID=UPI003D69016F